MKGFASPRVLSEWTLKKVVLLLTKFAQSTVRLLLKKHFFGVTIFCLLRGLYSVWNDLKHFEQIQLLPHSRMETV